MSIESKMAVRNLWRNPRRSILTMAAMGFASALLVFMLSFQLGSYAAMIGFSVKIHTGDMQVQAKGYNDEQNIRLVIDDPKKVEAAAAAIPHVTRTAPRSNAFSLVSSKERTYGALVIGIDPPLEAKVSTIKTILRQGSYLEEKNYGGALVGELLAENLQVGVGDDLTLLGQGRDGSIAATVVTVTGIFKSGQDEMDRSTLMINLDNFSDTYSMMGAVHEVVVMTDSLEQVDPVRRELAARVSGLGGGKPLVVLDWDQLLPGLKQGIEMDLVSGLIFYSILIVVVAFSILNTFLMSVLERTREFGILMAMGCTPGRLIRILLRESVAMMVIGIGAGMVLGVLVTLYFEAHGIPFKSDAMMAAFGIPQRLYPSLSIYSLLIGPAAVFIITFLTSLYPAFRVRRLSPVEAISYA